MGIGVVGARPSTQNDFITVYNGTSASSPLVSGAAALIMNANPDWTAMQVRESILMTASQHENPDNIYGYGIINIMDAINYDHTINTVNQIEFPKEFQISKPYPNPFNSSVSIDIAKPFDGHLIIEVLNINGRVISTLFDQKINQQTHTFNWNAIGVPSGIYFIKTNLNGKQYIQKSTFLK